MASDNLASLAITTTSGHLFLYTTPSLWDIASITDEATREDEVIQDVAEILNDLHQDTL
jgi:hypothetical protein